MTLSLSREEVMNFCRKNQSALLMFGQAGEDYISSRCLLLNNLLTGLTLSSQAIEKILKSFILLEDGVSTKLKGKDLHNPFKLKEELKNKRDYRLDKFDNLLKKLYGHYQSRYFDNKDSSKVKSTDELNDVDELWIYLIKIIPLPEEVKYRTSFFTTLFKDTFNTAYFIRERNQAISNDLGEMKKKYFQVFNHLYPKKRD